MQLLINYYYDYFTDKTKNGFDLLCSSVCIMILVGLYNRFIKEYIAPIEGIDEEKKLLYWEQAKRFYQDKQKRINAMKAAYVLDLITGKDIQDDK